METLTGLIILFIVGAAGVAAFLFRGKFSSLNVEEAIEKRDLNRLIQMMDYLIASDEDSTKAREGVLHLIQTEEDLFALVENVVLPAPYEEKTLGFLKDAFDKRVETLDEENLKKCLNSTTGLFALRSLASTVLKKRKEATAEE